MSDYIHHTVMGAEVLALLGASCNNGFCIDATVGEGGHAEIFLKKFPHLMLIGIDRDREIIEHARRRLAFFHDRVTLICDWFDTFFANFHTYGFGRPHMILFDLGIAMNHYQCSGRGFSFNADEPLDMRLDTDAPICAADVVNRMPPKKLIALLQGYGEERHAHKIVRAIVHQRNKSPFRTAHQLAEAIRKAIPSASGKRRIHPATRSFQALRIYVNNELERIRNGIIHAVDCLAVTGRMGVIAFHSLEDRISKRLFRLLARNIEQEMPAVNLLVPKPLVAADEERRTYPSARSAKLRAIEKCREISAQDHQLMEALEYGTS